MTPARYNYIKHLVLELPHISATMTKPSIHLNGSRPQSLANDYAEARAAVQNAINSLHQYACPHGRDYYPQGSNAVTIAIAEHANRVEKLQSVLHELEQLEAHCASFIK